ncbi:YetF domain-containing protein [Cytobacillus purgationiresistens]|uniref:Uncharacterized membrane protein YcaP (DUF421 family) n=1 Tax=Cytobacillus purgationiresistens TaxID=863449 RepID=A0ABU0AF31_9BACI|nr:DUF421 domain-containing protein [Cytobacillus purgationiresistens]MDQ0268700.1 uncharacterized membrane protein YcaP (DUF421 family) [Cytobacillus purgationiresistens]
MNEYFHIALVLIVGFAALFLMTKLLGKSQISQITPFDFISAIVLGELVGNALYDENTGMGQMLFSVALWTILIYTTETITQKFRKTRRFLEGEPSYVIKKGKINYNELKKNHMDLNQLQELLRVKGIFSIRECEYALLETNGTISALKKAPHAIPTIEDLQLKYPKIILPVNLILDGEILIDNLRSIGWDEPYLFSELEKKGISNKEDVLYADWKKGEGLHVQTY